MSTAATAIAAAVPKSAPIPPPSPFAGLLRRSRFASYDPAIRQTYSSPSAHAHRGDWGLKRPIALRRRNAFISLASFESSAQFTEWNHAENQVRFIRRVEEMGVTPKTNTYSSWYQGLGKAKTEWLLDSDFCPGEPHAVVKPSKPAETRVDLLGLGNKGPGQYGAHRPIQKYDDAHTQVIPNIRSMSQKQFERYLDKLRELRPKFQEYLKNRNITKSFYELAQDSVSDYHRQFLLSNTETEFQDRNTRQIEPQPHRNAGLMYAHPSRLDSHLTTEAQPGIVLQPDDLRARGYSGYSKWQENYMVSFGGLNATVSKKNVGGKVALFEQESEQGIDKSRLPDSIGHMRVKELELSDPPRVVGRCAQGLKAVKLKSEVVVNSSHFEFGIDNPHEPGTPEYIAAEARGSQSRPSDFSRRSFRLKSANPEQWNRNKAKSQIESKQVLQTLHDMVALNDKNNKS